MSTPEEIMRDFSEHIPLGSLVEIVLARGIEIRYRKRIKVIQFYDGRHFLRNDPAWNVQNTLTGTLQKQAGGYMLMRFETPDHDIFDVVAEQIERYRVLK